MKIRILDLDNCISNDEWRMDRINWSVQHPNKRYHEYHLLAGFDKPGNVDLFTDVPESIVIFTARPVSYNAITRHWLEEQGIKPFAIIMRNDNDFRPSSHLKADQLLWLNSFYGVKQSDIVHAYDDRQDIIDMYLAQGIPATRRAIHNTCAMTRPEVAA